MYVVVGAPHGKATVLNIKSPKASVMCVCALTVHIAAAHGKVSDTVSLLQPDG